MEVERLHLVLRELQSETVDICNNYEGELDERE